LSSSRLRYTNLPFPPYSYVPGQSAHPISDPAGHMVGCQHVVPAALIPQTWQNSTEYLFGVDLFNHAYYWESHEAWESLWHVAGRTGPVAVFLKGLIKLAAAGVKSREGVPRGVSRHAARATELFSIVAVDISDSRPRYCGIDLSDLTKAAQALADSTSNMREIPGNFELPIKLELTQL